MALLVGSGSRPMRDSIHVFIRQLRHAALVKWGHEISYEESALSALLRDTDYQSTANSTPGEDPVERLYRLDRLGNPERNAATLIQEVWQVFDKFLGAKIANFDGGGGGGGGSQRVLPMGRDLSDNYRRFYSPWYDACRNRKPIIVGTRKIRPVDVVFQIVVHARSINRIATAYDVRQQDIIEIVRDELLSLASRMDDSDNSGGAVNHGGYASTG